MHQDRTFAFVLGLVGPFSLGAFSLAVTRADAQPPARAVPTAQSLASVQPPAAQQPKVASLTTSLITPFFGAYYLEANIRATNTVGILFNTSYLTLDDGSWTTNTGTIGAGATYHFQHNALRGFYVETYAELLLASWRHNPSGKRAKLTPGPSAGVLFGYRFICDLGPMLDLGAGAIGLYFPRSNVETIEGVVSRASELRFYPGGKVNVGWAF